MRIALFGGTFDPIHSGHLRAAKAAARKFSLDRILFVPSGAPPHKTRDRLTSFHHRYAMVALACAADPRFVPSLLEAPTLDHRPRYSIDTVRAARRRLNRGDELYFLIGIDAFLDLPHWHEYHRLLSTVNFIVVSRPGFPVAEISKTAESIRGKRKAIHQLKGVSVDVASRDIREAIRLGRRVTGLVPPLVEQYILGEGLYRPGRAGRTSR